MSATTATNNEQDDFSDAELRAIQLQLALLAREATDYPLQCSLGTYAFLFDSKDEIKVILDTLNEELAQAA